MPSAHNGGPPTLTLWGRPGCHLCDDAEVVVERVSADLGVPWAKLSILDDETKRTAYAELIPVIEVDGEVIATWRVTDATLRAALRR